MLEWMAKFFEYGHTPEYVRNMNYWEYLNITESFVRIAERQQSKGKFSSGIKNNLHQKMIDNLKSGE